MANRTFHETEAPYSLANDAPEWERLDSMHNGISDYLGNKLSFAQIETPPKKILEIGSGSGAWAIQAAQTYPDAEVLAVDISPLPPRPLPENVKFKIVDVTQPLPFEPGSFDVVHTRLVLIHLAKYREVLFRVIELVKPGGWILLDELDHNMRGNPGPAIKKFYEIFHGYMALHSVEPLEGPVLELTLKKSGKFSEVHVQTASPYFMGGNDDPILDHLGEEMKSSFLRARHAMDPKIGLTEELKEAWHQELIDPERKINVELYFVWGRKR